MDKRVRFKKGMQRKFIDEALKKMLCPSLRELRHFGVGVKYSTLKNYYQEKNLIPLNLVEDLCELSGIDIKKLEIKLLDGSWGRVLGGRNGARRKKK